MSEQSKLEERLKRMKEPGKEGEKGDGESERVGKSRLEKALDDEDSDLAEELKRSRADEKLAQRKLNITKIEKERKKSDSGEEGEGKPLVKRWSVIEGKPVEDPEGEYSTFAQALAMANLAVRWTIVDDRPIESPDGEYRTFAQAFQVISLEKRGQDIKRWTIIDDKPMEAANGEYESFADAYRVAYLGLLKKQDAAAKPKIEDSEQMKVLTAKMLTLEQQLALALNPVNIMKTARAIRNDFEEAGLISSPPVAGGDTKGDPLELEKEKNRHTEEMRKLDTEDKYKTSLAETVAGVPKAIGKGISEDILRNIGAPPPEAGMEHFNCVKCGFPIVVGPGTIAVRCPKCGTAQTNEPQPPVAKEEVAKNKQEGTT